MQGNRQTEKRQQQAGQRMAPRKKRAGAAFQPAIQFAQNKRMKQRIGVKSPPGVALLSFIPQKSALPAWNQGAVLEGGGRGGRDASAPANR